MPGPGPGAELLQAFGIDVYDGDLVFKGNGGEIQPHLRIVKEALKGLEWAVSFQREKEKKEDNTNGDENIYFVDGFFHRDNISFSLRKRKPLQLTGPRKTDKIGTARGFLKTVKVYQSCKSMSNIKWQIHRGLFPLKDREQVVKVFREKVD
jgi:hypothetical protein